MQYCGSIPLRGALALVPYTYLSGSIPVWATNCWRRCLAPIHSGWKLTVTVSLLSYCKTFILSICEFPWAAS